MTLDALKLGTINKDFSLKINVFGDIYLMTFGAFAYFGLNLLFTSTLLGIKFTLELYDVRKSLLFWFGLFST